MGGHFARHGNPITRLCFGRTLHYNFRSLLAPTRSVPNADGILDLNDSNTLVDAFTTQQPAGDINGDGVWDLTDVNDFIQAVFGGSGY